MQNSFHMMKRILLLSFLAVFLNVAKSQVLINEICYTNAGAQQDFWSQSSDWIELYNATPGLAVNLNNYYLTDDKNNLYKWKIPSAITVPSFSFVTFWCSGRNVKEPGATGRYHTNFTIEQCRDQWIMLTYQGVIKDSMQVRRTKFGDNWGRYTDATTTPLNLTWKLFNGASLAPTFDASNNTYGAATIYLGYAPTPTFVTQAGFTSPATGNYDLFIPDTVNFQINYTQGHCTQLGGTIPCTSYTGCIGTTTSATTYTYVNGIDFIPMVGQTNVITAMTIPKGTYSLSYLPSFAETNTYFDGADIVVNPGFGVLSTVIDTVFFRSSAATTIHVEYFDKNKFYSEGTGGAAQPPNDAWLNQQRGFDVGFDDRTGYGCSLTGTVFNDPMLGTSTRSVYPNFEVRAAGKDNFSLVTPTLATAPPPKGTHMRDAFAQTYAMKNKFNLEGMHYKPIRTFVNGCYWGIYEFRELPDEDYLEYYFNIPKDSSDILNYHNGINSIVNGTDTGWVNTPLPPASGADTKPLFNYVKQFYPTFSSSPTAPQYGNVMKRLSQISFMDHFIYNSFLVNGDLTSFNHSWWRKSNPGGTNAPATSADTLQKWRYFMWDMNNILGLRRYPSVPQTLPLNTTMMMSPCVYNSTVFPQSATSYTNINAAYNGHAFMYQKFMLTTSFKNEYLNRYMDLLNTVLRCDKLLAHYNYFKNMFTPEMALHSVFWGVNQSPDWDDNMDTLRIRITERCTKIDSLLTKCINLAGPYNININVRPQGAGTVDFNSLHLNSFIWSGDYYQTKTEPYLNSFLEAYPIDTALYVFDHWEFTSTYNSETVLPHDLNTYGYLFRDSVSFIIRESDNITAVFADKRDDVVFPTGFTPNGDGNNDVFGPLGAAARYAKDYELRVWNRWGEEVFRSGEWNYGWDGNHKGQMAQTGVYAYLLTYKNVSGDSKIIKGNVTLIR